MKNFAKLLILILCFSAQCALANPLVGVLALDNREVPQYTYIFQNSSSLISGDIVNAFRNDGTFAVKYIDTKTLNQNDFAVVYNNYKYAGIIDLDKINSLNKKIGANYILLLTSNIDIQSHLFDETIWNKINVPGAKLIEPKYVVYTNAAFIDTKEQKIVWQEVYENKISAKDYNVLTTINTPNYTQIKEIKKISKSMAEEIAFVSKFYIFPELFEVKEEYSIDEPNIEECQPIPKPNECNIIPLRYINKKLLNINGK